MTSTPLIVSLQSVTYSYDRDQAAISVLAGVDLEVREGEFVVVAGPSGSGKSTFRALTIGFVFQAYHLIPVLTAAENVAWPLYFRGVPRRERMARAREALAAVGLVKEMNRFPGRLSGGQRQRVAIARAFVGRPRLLIADEPTASLDRNTASEIIALLASLRREEGVAVICATHDPLVAGAADRLLELRDGRLRQIPRRSLQLEEP
jgi:putative ABC transport system ATP-binding protein